MNGVLADTSIWVGYLRHGPRHPLGAELDAALESGVLLTCGPIVSELLTGTAERDRERLATILTALDWVDLDRREWIAAGELAAKLRRAGATVALTDVTIATAAIVADAELLAADTDFERIAGVEQRLNLRLVSAE